MSTDLTVLRRPLVLLCLWVCWPRLRIYLWIFLCLLSLSQPHKSLGSGCRLGLLPLHHYGSDAGTRTLTLGFCTRRLPLCLWACRPFPFLLSGLLATLALLASTDLVSTDTHNREDANSGIPSFRDDLLRLALRQVSTSSDLGWYFGSVLPNTGPATTSRNLYHNANSGSNFADDPISPPHLLSAPPVLFGPSASRVLHILSLTRPTSRWSLMH